MIVPIIPNPRIKLYLLVQSFFLFLIFYPHYIMAESINCQGSINIVIT